MFSCYFDTFCLSPSTSENKLLPYITNLLVHNFKKKKKASNITTRQRRLGREQLARRRDDQTEHGDGRVFYGVKEGDFMFL